ncbi:MAG: hypothetical protein ABSD03_16050, partial [Vulcanimicrobiaceae bacterium]
MPVVFFAAAPLRAATPRAGADFLVARFFGAAARLGAGRAGLAGDRFAAGLAAGRFAAGLAAVRFAAALGAGLAVLPRAGFAGGLGLAAARLGAAFAAGFAGLAGLAGRAAGAAFAT